jgi:hypothetical protein
VITLTRDEAQQVLDVIERNIVGVPRYRATELLRARLAQPEPEPVACIVKDCENHKHQGRFVGDLCSPCHAFITRNEGKYSQAYRNVQREWQSLTDEERYLGDARSEQEIEYAKTIEAKLKEKNT